MRSFTRARSPKLFDSSSCSIAALISPALTAFDKCIRFSTLPSGIFNPTLRLASAFGPRPLTHPLHRTGRRPACSAATRHQHMVTTRKGKMVTQRSDVSDVLQRSQGEGRETSSTSRDVEASNARGPGSSADDLLHSHAKKLVFGLPPSLAAGICYVCASMTMVLLNKHALSSFRFNCPNALLLLQCVVSVLLVKISSALGYCQLEPVSWRIVKVWAPANWLFVGMIWTSFYALKSIGVAMVTVLKNLTNILTIVGDFVFFSRVYPLALWGSMLLMIVSAIAGAITDLSFSATGYSWQFANCGFTAAYSLYLRNVMDKVVPLTSNRKPLGEFSMVLYNNLLSIPPILLIMLMFGEFSSLGQQPDLFNPHFMFAAFMSGIVGFLISFASLWFLSTTTPTIFSLVGSLNKIPVAFLGMLMFDSQISSKNVVSVSIGLAAGVMFAYAKAGSGKK